MPGIIPSKFRGQANGIINFMGGLGALLVFFGGKPLYDRRVSLPFMVTSIAVGRGHGTNEVFHAVCEERYVSVSLPACL